MDPLPIPRHFKRRFVDKDNRLSVRFFWRDNGNCRKPLVDLLDRLPRDASAINIYLAWTPYIVYLTDKGVFKLSENMLDTVTEWLGINTMAPWLLWLVNDGSGVQRVIGFADERDADSFEFIWHLMKT